MARGKSHWRLYAVACQDCHTSENLTRHHLKNKNGVKTGKIRVLCRRCHDIAEEEYAKLGILGPVEITPSEQLQLDYMNGLLPFYSLFGKSKK